MIRSLARRVLRPTGLLGAYWALTRSALRTEGWLRSIREDAPVDKDGNPLPWITYPCIEFLTRRLPTCPIDVFEWGSGASTRWWARRLARITSVEHDAAWHARSAGSMPASCNVLLRDVASPDYVTAIAESGVRFSVVVIDGEQRNECGHLAADHLSDDGIIVWDNTEHEDLYANGLGFLASRGFHRVDFWGMAPLQPWKTSTAILFRPRNLLGI